MSTRLTAYIKRIQFSINWWIFTHLRWSGSLSPRTLIVPVLQISNMRTFTCHFSTYTVIWNSTALTTVDWAGRKAMIIEIPIDDVPVPEKLIWHRSLFRKAIIKWQYWRWEFMRSSDYSKSEYASTAEGNIKDGTKWNAEEERQKEEISLKWLLSCLDFTFTWCQYANTRLYTGTFHGPY